MLQKMDTDETKTEGIKGYYVSKIEELQVKIFRFSVKIIVCISDFCYKLYLFCFYSLL